MAKYKANSKANCERIVGDWRSSGLSIEDYAFRFGIDTRELRDLAARGRLDDAGTVADVETRQPVVVELALTRAGLATGSPRTSTPDVIKVQSGDLTVTLPASAKAESITAVIHAVRGAR